LIFFIFKTSGAFYNEPANESVFPSVFYLTGYVIFGKLELSPNCRIVFWFNFKTFRRLCEKIDKSARYYANI